MKSPIDESASYRRVLDALEGRMPDKVPFHAYESPENAIVLFGRRVHEMWVEPDLVPRAMIHAADIYQNDVVYMRPSMQLPAGQIAEPSAQGLSIRDTCTGEITARVVADTKTLLPVRRLEPEVRRVSDVDRIPVTPCRTLLESPSWRSLHAYVEAFKGKKFLFGFACGQSANALDIWLGTEEAMLATLEDPGLCRAVMERKWEALREEILALHALGADGVYTGDACASCSFHSPGTYRDLFFEYQKRSIDFAHTLGMKALLHICGRISPILEDMAATGADVIESLDAPSAGGDIDLADAKRRVGSRVCLKGNLDAVHLLEPASETEIFDASLRALMDAGPGGFILSTEQVTRDTSARKVLAMVRARDSFERGMQHEISTTESRFPRAITLTGGQ